MSLPRRALVAAAATALLATTACNAGGQAATAPESKPPRVEISGPRVAATYDGGLMVLDGDSLKVVADIPHPGFLRLNPAGDQRHAFVSNADSFQLLDTGVEAQGHGDHFHYYATTPGLTKTVFPAPKAGHAVRHEDKVALWSDGAGTVQVHKVADLTKGPAQKPTWTAPHAHHGVAVPLHDEQLLVSVGDEKTRTGAAVIDSGGKTITESKDCPGLHGESVAKDDHVVIGCTDGALVFDGKQFTKVKAPDAYGRIGNQAGSEASPVTLGDYKVDKDAELERPTRISLIDSVAKELKLVDLGASYSFRSLGRGPKGEALVLTTDGNLTVIDPTTGAITNRIKVTAPWEEPIKWQRERPTLAVSGGVALVTEPSTNTVHAVHLASQKVVDSVKLPHAPNEIVSLVQGEQHEHKD
ncbi:zinc metallochaperone AztD [Mariniluteicoccus flavus]